MDREPSFDARALLDRVADGGVLVDDTGRVAFANAPFAAWCGTAAPAGLALADVLADGGAPLPCAFADLAAPVDLVLSGTRWLRLVERAPLAEHRVFTCADVTDINDQRRALEDRLARLEATFERMDQGVMMVNAERVVEVCNRRAIELLGLPPTLMAGKPTFAAVLAYQWATDEFSHTPDDIRKFVESGGILDHQHSYDRQRPDGRVIEIHSVPVDGGSR